MNAGHLAWRSICIELGRSVPLKNTINAASSFGPA